MASYDSSAFLGYGVLHGNEQYLDSLRDQNCGLAMGDYLSAACYPTKLFVTGVVLYIYP